MRIQSFGWLYVVMCLTEIVSIRQSTFARSSPMNPAFRIEEFPRYTVEDYLEWQGDWELWTGIAIAMTPSPFGGHQRTIARMSHLILESVEKNKIRGNCCDCEVFVELDWIVDRETVVRPDLSVVCGLAVEGHLQQPPAIVIEVRSPSTSTNDRTFKYKLYEQQGVRHYIMIDPESEQVEHCKLEGGKYQLVPVVQTASIQLTLHDACSIHIECNRIFQ